MSKSRILIVDDELIVREDLRDVLEGLGYEVTDTAVTAREAIAKTLASRPDLVLMDVKLKGEMDGIEAAQHVHAQLACPVVFLTAFADEGTIARAAAARPYGYVTKPFTDRAIRATIEVALHRRRDEMGLAPTSGATSTSLASAQSFHGLVGRSAAMRALIAQISRVAHVNTTVLIEGETGTGKERVARALHHAGSRAEMPFIAVNCAGLTETLTASELFGHRRGAFTGAVQDRKGLFETAAGGTLFLDEVGDVPRNQQPFLLRVLEEREITRVGDSTPRRIDVRVLAASNRNLADEVAAGRFRSDLFYRIRVARLTVPPLRERAGDVALLSQYFLRLLRSTENTRAEGLGDDALEALQTYAWPGNVRELKNAIEFAAIRCSGVTIRALDLPPEVSETRRDAESPSLSPEDERTRLMAALDAANGNRTEAARLLGISRATLYRRLGESEARADSEHRLSTSADTDSIVS